MKKVLPLGINPSQTGFVFVIGFIGTQMVVSGT